MMRDPKTDPIPAPDPATPTVAAPAPMNLAAESMSLRATEVERARLVTETGALMVACVAQTKDARGLWYTARTFLEQLVAMIRANIFKLFEILTPRTASNVNFRFSVNENDSSLCCQIDEVKFTQNLAKTTIEELLEPNAQNFADLKGCFSLLSWLVHNF